MKLKSNKTILKPIIEVNEPSDKIEDSKIQINKQEIGIDTTVIPQNTKQTLKSNVKLEPPIPLQPSQELIEKSIQTVDYLIKACNTIDVKEAKKAAENAIKIKDDIIKEVAKQLTLNEINFKKFIEAYVKFKLDNILLNNKILSAQLQTYKNSGLANSIFQYINDLLISLTNNIIYYNSDISTISRNTVEFISFVLATIELDKYDHLLSSITESITACEKALESQPFYVAFKNILDIINNAITDKQIKLVLNEIIELMKNCIDELELMDTAGKSIFDEEAIGSFVVDDVVGNEFNVLLIRAISSANKAQEVADELEKELSDAKKSGKSSVKQQKTVSKFVKSGSQRIFDIYMPNHSKFGNLNISPGNINILFMNKKNKEVCLQFNEIKDPGKRLYLSQSVHIDELSKYDNYYNKNKHKCKCRCHKNNFKLLRDININCEGYNDYYESKQQNTVEEITLTCIATGNYDWNRANNPNETISGTPNIIKYYLTGSCGHTFNLKEKEYYFNVDNIFTKITSSEIQEIPYEELVQNRDNYKEEINSLIKTNILGQLKNIKSCKQCKNNNIINTNNINIINKSLLDIWIITIPCTIISCGMCNKYSHIIDLCDTSMFANIHCLICDAKLMMPEKYWKFGEIVADGEYVSITDDMREDGTTQVAYTAYTE